MKYNEIFDKWNLKSIKLNIKFANLEFSPNQADKDAAWEMYVELITRITTQDLNEIDGDEAEALQSIYNLFPITRSILKNYGRKCNDFSKIAIVVLNQVIRPFTVKWHKIMLTNTMDQQEVKLFRNELKELQNALKDYSKLLADMAGVEDIASINE